MRYTVLLLITIGCFYTTTAQTNQFSFAFQQPVSSLHSRPGLYSVTAEYSETINMDPHHLKDPRSRDPEKVSTNLIIVGGSLFVAGAALVGAGIIVENNSTSRYTPGMYYRIGGALIGGIGFNLAGAGTIVKLVTRSMKRKGLRS